MTTGYRSKTRPKTIAGPIGGALLLVVSLIWLADTGLTSLKTVYPALLAYTSLHAIVIGLRPRQRRRRAGRPPRG